MRKLSKNDVTSVVIQLKFHTTQHHLVHNCNHIISGVPMYVQDTNLYKYFHPSGRIHKAHNSPARSCWERFFVLPVRYDYVMYNSFHEYIVYNVTYSFIDR